MNKPLHTFRNPAYPGFLLKCLVLFFILSVLSCHAVKTEIIEYPETGKKLIIWACSDIQPRNSSERKDFETAVADIHDNFPGINTAIVCGDIASVPDHDTYSWYLDTKKALPHASWYELAGNHDVLDIEVFRKYIQNNPDYTALKGNILIIIMSNEENKRTYISDSAFAWWRSLVISNQDKIIITATHCNLNGCGLASCGQRWSIFASDRFTKVLKSYRVDIWLSGHSHYPGWISGTLHVNKDLNGACFIDTGAIHREIFTTAESRLLFFTPGSDTAVVRFRDHISRTFYPRGNNMIKLSHAYRP